ncbi:adenine phosphoribosyltransferase [Devriesea agamarum]|uniref:adenine phosphoribosyltransferase n=1 Tax=Devriesea agamarum TaxID=472569 RepID=UPI00071C5A34|nr:adenine phosphoribosyltransferase [Devriesea agamarum]
MSTDLVTAESIHDLLTQRIAEYPDFPEPGVLFRDISPLLGDGAAFRQVIEYWAGLLPSGIDHIVGAEARGFVLGAPLAYHLGVGFVPVRKVGKLPGTPRSVSYSLEYGTATVEIPENALEPGEKVVVIDDLLATGGTACATCELVETSGAELLAVSFLMELVGLGGREKLVAEVSAPILPVFSVQN